MLELTVRGTPYERGRQIGATYADGIRVDVRRGGSRPLRGWTRDRAEAAMGNILFAMLRYTPHYVEELRGLADGAGIEFRDAFLLNTAPAFTPLRAAFTPEKGPTPTRWTILSAAARTSPCRARRWDRCWSRRSTARSP